MQKSGVSAKAVFVGFVLFFVAMVAMPSPGASPWIGVVTYFIPPLIAGFVTGVIAKESEIAHGAALGILLILFGAFSLFVIAAEKPRGGYQFEFLHALRILIIGAGAVAGGTLRKYTKREDPSDRGNAA